MKLQTSNYDKIVCVKSQTVYQVQFCGDASLECDNKGKCRKYYLMVVPCAIWKSQRKRGHVAKKEVPMQPQRPPREKYVDTGLFLLKGPCKAKKMIAN